MDRELPLHECPLYGSLMQCKYLVAFTLDIFYQPAWTISPEGLGMGKLGMDKPVMLV